MIVNSNKRSYGISAHLISADIKVIKVYILGAINGFCNKHPDEAFSVRSLFGGNNKNWEESPLQKIYDYYIRIGKSDLTARKQAAQDVGKLLTQVLNDDTRKFEIAGKTSGKEYKIVK